MKTYTEEQGLKPFDWNAFLANPNITPAEWAKAVELSSKWVTCACGNQCATLPRGVIGEPLDRTLLHLGRHFFEAISSPCYDEFSNDRQTALDILKDIEIRSAQLLNERLHDTSNDLLHA